MASMVSTSRRVSSCQLRWEVKSTRMSGSAIPVLRQVGDEAVRHAQLPLGGAGLSLLVDGERDDRGAVLPDVGITRANRDVGPSPSS
jgi:hypothetical protein